jgi:hypothetical protein
LGGSTFDRDIVRGAAPPAAAAAGHSHEELGVGRAWLAGCGMADAGTRLYGK